MLPFKAAVAYYGGGIAPELIKSADKLNADMLFFWGGLDPHIPLPVVGKDPRFARDVVRDFRNVSIAIEVLRGTRIELFESVEICGSVETRKGSKVRARGSVPHLRLSVV